MEIHGIQKMTLLDYPEKVACTIFTARCNFRCPFCHNASLVTHVDAAAAISEEEVFSFLAKRQGILDGVCITGGEPLLQPDIEEFIRKVKELGYQVKLDTNGSNVLRLRRLVEQGLVDYVAMDIKNAPDKYGMTIGIEEYDMSNIFQSVDFLMSGDVPYEFRTTVVRGLHTGGRLLDAAKAIRGARRYFLQQFVDSGDLIGEGYSAFSGEEMRDFLSIVSPYVAFAALRGV